MHPPSFATDGAETWWQSPPLSRGVKYNEVNLTIDLGQVSTDIFNKIELYAVSYLSSKLQAAPFLQFILVFFYLSYFASFTTFTALLNYAKLFSPCKKQNERSFFFLFQYLTNYLTLKLRTNENNERRGAFLCTEKASTFCLCSHRDPFAFLIVLLRLWGQKISMCYLILRKLHRIRKVFENNITSL